MTALLQDPMFFYSVAFVIFLALAWHYGRKPALLWIDTEILKIRDQLENARRLRSEAESLLADYKRKQVTAMAEAEAIVHHAQEEAARLKAQSEVNLRDLLAKHELHAAERIRLAEADAVAAVRMSAVDAAMHMARSTLKLQMSNGDATRLTDQAIADIGQLTSNRAKAA